MILAAWLNNASNNLVARNGRQEVTHKAFVLQGKDAGMKSLCDLDNPAAAKDFV